MASKPACSDTAGLLHTDTAATSCFL
jgi:hypothetical protein